MGRRTEKIVMGRDAVWHKGMTAADLLNEMNEDRPLVGIIVNRRYKSRSHFDRTKIPNEVELQLIPWEQGMTVSDLLEYDIDEEYFAAAVINGLYIPENRFGDTRIPQDAEVWLLPPVGGG